MAATAGIFAPIIGFFWAPGLQENHPEALQRGGQGQEVGGRQEIDFFLVLFREIIQGPKAGIPPDRQPVQQVLK